MHVHNGPIETDWIYSVSAQVETTSCLMRTASKGIAIPWGCEIKIPRTHTERGHIFLCVFPQTQATVKRHGAFRKYLRKSITQKQC